MMLHTGYCSGTLAIIPRPAEVAHDKSVPVSFDQRSTLLGCTRATVLHCIGALAKLLLPAEFERGEVCSRLFRPAECVSVFHSGYCSPVEPLPESVGQLKSHEGKYVPYFVGQRSMLQC